MYFIYSIRSRYRHSWSSNKCTSIVPSSLYSLLLITIFATVIDCAHVASDDVSRCLNITISAEDDDSSRRKSKKQCLVGGRSHVHTHNSVRLSFVLPTTESIFQHLARFKGSAVRHIGVTVAEHFVGKLHSWYENYKDLKYVIEGSVYFRLLWMKRSFFIINTTTQACCFCKSVAGTREHLFRECQTLFCEKLKFLERIKQMPLCKITYQRRQKHL